MAWLLLYYTLEVFKWLIIIRAVMSWFVPNTTSNLFVEVVRRATEPILRPISNLIPDMGGVDVSPVVAFLAIVLLQQVVLNLA